MKTIFTLQFLLFTILCFAQPVITTAIVPETGTTYKAAYNEGTIDIGPSGENQTWDFSALATSFDLNFAILDPADAPGATSYPDAEFVWNLVEFENFLFYDVTENVISQLGGVNGVVGDISFQTINTDWEDGFQLPLTYLDTYDFLTVYDNYLFGDFISSGQRNATLTADGYGTVITKFGTYENVLRVKIVRQEFGILFTQYAWLHPDSFLPVMVYDTDEDGETADSYYFTDLSDVISSTKQIEDEENLTFAFESGKLTIDGLDDAIVQLQLIDFMGKSIGIEQSQVSQTSWEVHYDVNNTIMPAVLVIESGMRTFTKKVYLY